MTNINSEEIEFGTKIITPFVETTTSTATERPPIRPIDVELQADGVTTFDDTTVDDGSTVTVISKTLTEGAARALQAINDLDPNQETSHYLQLGQTAERGLQVFTRGAIPQGVEIDMVIQGRNSDGSIDVNYKPQSGVFVAARTSSGHVLSTSFVDDQGWVDGKKIVRVKLEGPNAYVGDAHMEIAVAEENSVIGGTMLDSQADNTNQNLSTFTPPPLPPMPKGVTPPVPGLRLAGPLPFFSPTEPVTPFEILPQKVGTYFRGGGDPSFYRSPLPLGYAQFRAVDGRWVEEVDRNVASVIGVEMTEAGAQLGWDGLTPDADKPFAFRNINLGFNGAYSVYSSFRMSLGVGGVFDWNTTIPAPYRPLLKNRIYHDGAWVNAYRGDNSNYPPRKQKNNTPCANWHTFLFRLLDYDGNGGTGWVYIVENWYYALATPKDPFDMSSFRTRSLYVLGSRNESAQKSWVPHLMTDIQIRNDPAGRYDSSPGDERLHTEGKGALDLTEGQKSKVKYSTLGSTPGNRTPSQNTKNNPEIDGCYSAIKTPINSIEITWKENEIYHWALDGRGESPWTKTRADEYWATRPGPPR